MSDKSIIPSAASPESRISPVETKAGESVASSAVESYKKMNAILPKAKATEYNGELKGKLWKYGKEKSEALAPTITQETKKEAERGLVKWNLVYFDAQSTYQLESGANAQFDAFLNSGKGIKDLNDKEAGRMLSYVFVSGAPGLKRDAKDSWNPAALELLMNKIARDPDDFISISSRWKNGIDRKLMINASHLIGMIDSLKDVAKTGISLKIDDFVNGLPTKLSPDAGLAVKREISDLTVSVSSDSDYFIRLNSGIGKILKKHGIDLRDDLEKSTLPMIRAIFEFKRGAAALEVSMAQKENPKLAGEISAASLIKDPALRKSAFEELEKRYASDKASLDAVKSARLLKDTDTVAKNMATLGSVASMDGVSATMARGITVASPRGDFSELWIAKAFKTETKIKQQSADLAPTVEKWTNSKRSITEMEEGELLSLKSRIEASSSLDVKDRELLSSIAELLSARRHSMKVVIAVANGISMSEVDKMERRGIDLKDAYAKASNTVPEQTSWKTLSVDIGNSGFSWIANLKLSSGETVKLASNDGSLSGFEIAGTGNRSEPYEIRLHGKFVMKCSKEDLPSSLESTKILTDCGLWFFAPVSERIFDAVSVKSGKRISPRDGSFTVDESKRVLRSLFMAIGEETIASGVDSPTIVSTARRRSVEMGPRYFLKAAADNGIVDPVARVVTSEGLQKLLSAIKA